MFYVYAIKSNTDKLYIGQTANLEKRINRHNKITKNKPSSYTNKNGSDWKLVYLEECDTRKKAVIREKQLKSYQGRLFLKNKLSL